ncbi:hypothetical protein GNI_052130 [Gregarina niphandrodes]|uniref:Uncharacterized protein n=1 Tax=Gregarina niphandrodes TaxID=110365 RepID=A0A023B993_GRENI|nr:hypothetical protein GNI_052130 [Gregarina niphandrodes]EZG71895.1 hypothetical protein GNI_052130 [Gregarina niphandrodes]|eukprot:XP_011129805.1 hypothetical protein GNI_052130 [Gregarina niphandrodes]
MQHVHGACGGETAAGETPGGANPGRGSPEWAGPERCVTGFGGGTDFGEATGLGGGGEMGGAEAGGVEMGGVDMDERGGTDFGEATGLGGGGEMGGAEAGGVEMGGVDMDERGSTMTRVSGQQSVEAPKAGDLSDSSSVAIPDSVTVVALPFAARGPALGLCSNDRRLYVAALQSVHHLRVPLLVRGDHALGKQYEYEIPGKLVHGNRQWIVVGTSRDVYIQDKKGRWLPPVRVAPESSGDWTLNAVYVRNSLLFLGVGRFVVCLDLAAVNKALAGRRQAKEAVPLQAAWGSMHALHTEDVHALYLMHNGLLISGGDDGLVCITKLRCFDPLVPAVLYNSQEYDDDFESSEDLLKICVGIGDCIKQFWVDDKVLSVLTHTGRTACYSVGCLDAVSPSDTFACLLQPSFEALELGAAHVWCCPCGARANCVCDEPGAVEVVGLVKTLHHGVCAVVTHTHGGVCVVQLNKGKPTVLGLLTGIHDDHPRSVIYSKEDQSLVIGTESGKLYKEASKLKAGISNPYHASR